MKTDRAMKLSQGPRTSSRVTAAGSLGVLVLVWSTSAAEKPTGDGATPLTDTPPVMQLSFVEPDDRGEQDPQPAVTIYADGTVVVPDGSSDGISLQGRISPPRLNKLLHEAVRTQRLLECDARELEQALIRESGRTGLAWQVAGAATTVIRVRWEGRDHEVRCPAAALLESRFPGIDELRRIGEVQRRLQNVKCIVQAGGVEAAERLAALANRELRSGDGLSVSIDDLQLVRSSGDGLCYAQFIVTGDDLAANVSRRMVSVIQTPGAAPQVSVTQIPPARP